MMIYIAHKKRNSCLGKCTTPIDDDDDDKSEDDKDKDEDEDDGEDDNHKRGMTNK